MKEQVTKNLLILLQSQWTRGKKMAGKGDKQRPISITKEEWNNNWDLIFKKDKKDKKDNESKRKSNKTNG